MEAAGGKMCKCLRDRENLRNPFSSPSWCRCQWGAEAAVHAVHRYLDDMSNYPDKVVVKLDFKNAFNCLRRGRMLEAVQEWIPELYKFCCYNA